MSSTIYYECIRKYLTMYRNELFANVILKENKYINEKMFDAKLDELVNKTASDILRCDKFNRDNLKKSN